MALTEDEKKEIAASMARGIADGLKLFRSEAEEEAAKNPPPTPLKKEGETGGTTKHFGGLAGFILGDK